MVKKEHIKIICKSCKKEFLVYPYRKDSAEFCSRNCKGIYKRGTKAWNSGKQNKIKIICKICKTEFKRYPSRKAIFCSPKCQAIDKIGIKNPGLSERMKGNKYALGHIYTKEARQKIGISNSGENCHFWKGNKMAEYPKKDRIRKSIEYRIWRNAVFELYDYTCQKTGERGGKIVAHHIQNFEDYPDLRLAIDNGIVLTEKSHKEFHQKYGTKNNTREQLEEFLGR